MVADVPLAVWLSGGIDSSTITHYAAEASPTPLHTFSISFKGRTFDESDYIGAVAKQYGTRHEQLDLNTGLELADAIQEFAKFADDPNADAGALPVWFLSHLTRQSCTVALSGDGADEIFGGYLTYQADELARIARRFPPAALRLFRQALKFWPVSDEKISLHDVLKRFLDGCAMQPGRSHVYWNGTFSEAEKRLLVSESLPDTLSGLLRDIPAAARPLDQWMWFDQKYYLPDDILTKVDRMSMAHSLEVRPPFLDHRIVEFAASLPSAFKLHGAGRKVILKELMKGKLPPSVLTRKKVGFDIPAHDWLRGPLRELMTDTIQWGLSAHPDLFRRAEVESCMRRHAARQDNLGYHLWGLMILFLWMRQWRIQTVPASGSFHRPAESAFLST
jgi:asparagine synthase (glutamine-hydrolysing)